MKKFASFFVLFLMTCLMTTMEVNAATRHGLSLTGVVCDSKKYTDADPLNNNDQCLADYQDGLLDSYVLSNTDEVEPGTTVMLGLGYVHGLADEVMGINAMLEYDSTIWKASEYEGDIYYVADTTVLPKKRNLTWDVAAGFKDNSISTYLASNLSSNAPITADATFLYVFLTLDEKASGSISNFSFGNNAADRMTDYDGTNIQFDPVTFSLTVAGESQSDDATLSALTLTNGGTNYLPESKFTGGDKTKVEYSIVVPNNVSTIDIDGTVNNAKASINGEDLGEKSLSVGNNTFNVEVTAEARNTLSYKINVYRLNNDAKLTNISFTNGIAIDSFSSDTLEYNIENVPYATKNTTVSGTLSDSNATIKSGAGAWSLTNHGNTVNTKNIVVEAENCKDEYSSVLNNSCTTKTYKVNVKRVAPSTNNYLSSLVAKKMSASGEVIAFKDGATFDKETNTYTLKDVDYDITKINISAVLEDSKGKIISGTGDKTLSVGDNSFEVLVKSEEENDDASSTGNTYTINVRRLSNDVKLKSLNVGSDASGSFTPAFNPNNDASIQYTYTYNPAATEITVTATVNDTDKAKVEIIDASESEVGTGNSTLNSASKTFDATTTKVGVIVTAENGTISTYIVNLARLTSSNSYLKSLELTTSDGENSGASISLTPKFTQNNRSYTATVNPDVTGVNVNAVVADNSYAEVGTILGNTNFGFGENTVTIPVKAENGTTENYTVVVTRKEYSDATLKSLIVNGDEVTLEDGVFEYTVNSETNNPYPYETKKVTIAAEANNYKAKSVSINGTNKTGVTNSVDYTLSSRENTVSIVVTAQDNSTKTYTIKLYREPNTAY